MRQHIKGEKNEAEKTKLKWKNIFDNPGMSFLIGWGGKKDHLALYM